MSTDEVNEVKLREDGGIDHVVTQGHGAVHGELFVDCTGFRGLLINQALQEPFISFADSLLCDSAIALQVPSDIEADGIEPYTTATAMNSRLGVEHPALRTDRDGVRLLQRVHLEG